MIYSIQIIPQVIDRIKISSLPCRRSGAVLVHYIALDGETKFFVLFC